jgi:hypothetical protein
MSIKGSHFFLPLLLRLSDLFNRFPATFPSASPRLPPLESSTGSICALRYAAPRLSTRHHSAFSRRPQEELDLLKLCCCSRFLSIYLAFSFSRFSSRAMYVDTSNFLHFYTLWNEGKTVSIYLSVSSLASCSGSPSRDHQRLPSRHVVQLWVITILSTGPLSHHTLTHHNN